MTRLHIQVAAILVSSFFSPLYAQQPEPTPSQIQDLESTNLETARQWAQDNAVPQLLYLNDASVVGIVGFQNAHPVFFTTHNQRAASITNTSRLYDESGLGFNLDGSNLTIGIWDASIVYDSHQEHKVRIIPRETGGTSNHATHVAGTLVASGITPESRGMAPKARLHSYNWNFHLSEMIVEAENNMLVSNHSYGRIAGWHKFNLTQDSSRWQWFGDPDISAAEDYTFGYYDQEASNFDHITYTNPYYLPVVSAGNERDDHGPTTGLYLALDLNNRWREYDISTHPLSPDGGSSGYDTITSMALSKNALTVGSVYTDTSDNSLNLSVFSSSGPTDDGRVKPDLVGVGERLFSTVATGISDYAIYSGTSMATPNVAGSLLLLQQLSSQLFGKYMRAATLKGLVIHTASDLGNSGPDYKYGWGLLDAEKAALHLEHAFRSPTSIQEEELPRDSLFTLELVHRAEGDIRVTLAWTDPRFTPLKADDPSILNDRTPVLIHDLNIRLTHTETNRSYFPFVLDPANPSEIAYSGVNRVDPVEQIYVQNAPPGAYTLEINAHNGPGSAERQAFSLIVSGLEEAVSLVELAVANVTSAPGEVFIEWSTISQNSTGNFIVERAPVFASQSRSTEQSFFQQIAVVESEGISTELKTYAFKDPLLIAGSYKYRILFQPQGSSTKVLLDELDVVLPAPEAFEIFSFFPNPASHQATLVLDIPEETTIRMQVYNSLGQLLLSFQDSKRLPGRHFLTLDLSSLGQGTYIARIETASNVRTKPFIVIK